MSAITLITLKEQIVAGLRDRSGLLGAIAISNDSGYSVLAEGSDLLLIVVYEDHMAEESISHYSKDGLRIQENRTTKSLLEARAGNREDRIIIHWMMQGEIWVDTNTYLEDFRTGLLQYPGLVKEQKLLSEFSLFLKRYLQCKDHLHADQVLDAYSCILRAIHHWARIVIIEEGVHPEIMVWDQVRKYNPGVYKLYDELTSSPETLKQRVELVLLACEFSVMSKMESCCQGLIRILEESEAPLSISELLVHPILEGLTNPNLPLMMSKLAKKGIIKEVAVASDDQLFSLEVKYTK